jgi:hypothetical protein
VCNLAIYLVLWLAGVLLPWSAVHSQSIDTQSTEASKLTRVQQLQVYDEASHILGGNANVISRWVSDINYHIIGTNWFSEQAASTLAEIALISKLELSASAWVPQTAESYLALLKETPAVQLSSCDGLRDWRSGCANFIIVQTSNVIMQQLAKTIPLRKVYQRSLEGDQSVSCFFSPFVGSRQTIHQAFVYVNENLDEAMLETCLHEEIDQSFGLFNDYTDSVYFSFNNKVEPKSITGYDKELLKIVYHPDFAPGTPVFRVLKRFMEELGLDPFE